jgi:hypothetical protein
MAPIKDTQKKDQIEVIEQDPPTPETPVDPTKIDISQYVQFLEAMKVTKRHLTVAPTNTPKNFYDQIQFFDDGITPTLYIWINGTWRSVVLA